MDARFDAFAALGLRQGEAHVLRNAGGVITDDVIRSLAISQRRLGTEEVMLIHHTNCGLQTITDDGFRAELQDATGMAPSFAIESSPTSTPRAAVDRPRPQLAVPAPPRPRARFVYDSTRGRCARSPADASGMRAQLVEDLVDGPDARARNAMPTMSSSSARPP